MNDMLVTLRGWELGVKTVRERMYGTPTPRERERWHAVWLLARGWSAAEVAEALESDAHTIGDWAEDFRKEGLAGLAFEQSDGSPPSSTGRNKQN